MIPNIFNGVRIMENSLCLEDTDEQVRTHIRKPWMTVSYHNRIQKKWRKRFGYIKRPCAYETPLGLVCHPDIAAELRKLAKPETPSAV